jgi:hypothetical protein
MTQREPSFLFDFVDPHNIRTSTKYHVTVGLTMRLL